MWCGIKRRGEAIGGIWAATIIRKGPQTSWTLYTFFNRSAFRIHLFCTLVRGHLHLFVLNYGKYMFVLYLFWTLVCVYEHCIFSEQWQMHICTLFVWNYGICTFALYLWTLVSTPAFVYFPVNSSHLRCFRKNSVLFIYCFEKPLTNNPSS